MKLKSFQIYLGGMESRSHLEYVAGDEGYLRCYYKCSICETIVVDDHHENLPDIRNYNCPTCYPQQDFPFEYILPDKLDKYKVKIPVLKGQKLGTKNITLRERLKIGII